MDTTAKEIYRWDNVDYDYPMCGGTEGVVYDDGRVVIEHHSNYQGQTTGGVSTWTLDVDALDAIRLDANQPYNNTYTYSEMLQGDGIAYIATLIEETEGIRVC